MKDQHKKIKGYRDLSQFEIDLMNKAKEHAEKTEALLNEIKNLRDQGQAELCPLRADQYEESIRCLDIAKTNLQQGQMWLVRSVALPESF